MTDIVARVRDACFIGLVPKDKAEIFLEAADEIERLREENTELKDARIDLRAVENIVGSVQDLLLTARRQYDTHLIQKDLIASKDDEIERLRTEIERLQAEKKELLEAIRLTAEYYLPPALDNWEWWKVYGKYADPEDAQRMKDYCDKAMAQEAHRG